MLNEEKYNVGDIIEEYGDVDYLIKRYAYLGYKIEVMDDTLPYGGVNFRVVEVRPKATELEKREYMHDLLDLIMRINGGCVTRSGKGHATAFYDYSGHTNCIYIQIYVDGWESQGRHEKVNYTIDFDRDSTLFEAWEIYHELEDLEKNLNE